MTPKDTSSQDERPPGKNKRLIGDKRVQLEADIVQRYEAGRSIRKIMDALPIKLSYGTIHRILKAHNVEMRGQGATKRG